MSECTRYKIEHVWWTTAEAAALAGCSPSLLHKWVERGIIDPPRMEISEGGRRMAYWPQEAVTLASDVMCARRKRDRLDVLLYATFGARVHPSLSLH
jgi:transposase-like protein